MRASELNCGDEVVFLQDVEARYAEHIIPAGRRGVVTRTDDLVSIDIGTVAAPVRTWGADKDLPVARIVGGRIQLPDSGADEAVIAERRRIAELVRDYPVGCSEGRREFLAEAGLLDALPKRRMVGVQVTVRIDVDLDRIVEGEIPTTPHYLAAEARRALCAHPGIDEDDTMLWVQLVINPPSVEPVSYTYNASIHDDWESSGVTALAVEREAWPK